LAGLLDAHHHLDDLVEQKGEVVHGDAQHGPPHVVGQGESLSLPVGLLLVGVDKPTSLLSSLSKHRLLLPIPRSLVGSPFLRSNTQTLEFAAPIRFLECLSVKRPKCSSTTYKM
jgi:hypothetical protein